jgi:macrolide transport system ATP-binding/permease protein
MSVHHGSSARRRAQLVASDVCVERGGRPVLTDVTFAVNRGTRLGIVGENGRGKSTLLHVLSGALIPDRGEVQRVGSVGDAEQEITVDAGRTVGGLIDVELAEVRAALAALEESSAALAGGREDAEEASADALEVAVALDVWEADRHVDVALSELGAVTDRTRLLSELSVGERYRVRLACLLGAGHDFLLLDEPTNHLDQHGLEYLIDALPRSEAGVVLVSHDRRLLSDAATKVLDLDPSSDGRPRLHGDGYAGYAAGRQAELARWTQRYERYLVEHQRLADDLRLQSRWRPPKGTGKHQRATRAPSAVRAVHRRIEDLAAHEVTRPNPPLRFQLPDLPPLPGLTLLHADEVTVEGRLETPVSVALRSGDRLVVTGPNGAGKSTLLQVMAGGLPPDHGVAAIAATPGSASLRRSRGHATGAPLAPCTTHGSDSSGRTASTVPPSRSARSDCSRTRISPVPSLTAPSVSSAGSTSPSPWPLVPTHCCWTSQRTTCPSPWSMSSPKPSSAPAPQSASSPTTARCATTSPTGRRSRSRDAGDAALVRFEPHAPTRTLGTLQTVALAGGGRGARRRVPPAGGRRL